MYICRLLTLSLLWANGLQLYYNYTTKPTSNIKDSFVITDLWLGLNIKISIKQIYFNNFFKMFLKKIVSPCQAIYTEKLAPW